MSWYVDVKVLNGTRKMTIELTIEGSISEMSKGAYGFVKKYHPTYQVLGFEANRIK